MKLGDSGPTRRLDDEEKPRSCTVALRPQLRKRDIAAVEPGQSSPAIDAAKNKQDG